FRGPDVAAILNVNAEIPPYLMKKFCENMDGKEIKLDMRTQMKSIDEKSFNGMSHEDLIKLTEIWHKYPYHEASKYRIYIVSLQLYRERSIIVFI
ncbi:unnamed protein product, partial [marine sediment metagenome]